MLPSQEGSEVKSMSQLKRRSPKKTTISPLASLHFYLLSSRRLITFLQKTFIEVIKLVQGSNNSTLNIGSSH
jgi:hypothetical protein